LVQYDEPQMKNVRWHAWLLFCAAVFAGGAALAGPAGEASFKLTAKERAWLAEHPEIHIGVANDAPPLDFSDHSGNPAGMGVDFLNEMNRRLGGVLRIHGGSLDGNLKKAKARELDGVMDVAPRSDLDEFLVITQPYLDLPQVIVGRRGARYYPTAMSLMGHTVALDKGSGNIQWFKDNFPSVRLRLYDTTADALDAVARSQADAYVGNRAVALFLVEQEMLTNLHLQGRLEKSSARVSLGVRKDWPVAAALLDRALGDVLDREGRRIRAKWFETAGKAGGRFQPGPVEKSWLEAHPRIRIGVPDDGPPMDFVDDSGQAAGIGVDFLELLNERLEGRIEMEPGVRARLVDDFNSGRLDALMDVAPGRESENSFICTKPYAILPHVIVGRKGGDYFDSLESLAGRTVAVEADSPVAAYLRANLRKVAVTEYPSVREALVAVSAEKADAYIGNRAGAIWWIARELLPTLQVQGGVRETASVHAIGVRKDLAPLATLLGGALASLSPQGVQEIFERWGGAGQDRRADQSWIRLSPEEKQWLDNHPVIRYGSNTRWSPVEFADKDGIPRGISRDYLDRFSRALGVEFRYVPISSWRQAQAKLREGEVDLLTSLTKASTKKTLDFSSTPPYLSLQTAIFTRENTPYVGEVSELKELKVAVVPGYAMPEFLLTQCPDIRQVEAKSIPAALQMLESGQVDAFVDTLLVSSHYIQLGGHKQIKVAGETGFVVQPAFACRKEWDIFVHILDKVLEGIDEKEKNAIARKWMSVTYEQRIDYTKLYKIGGAALALMGLFLYWNRRMASEIRRRRAVEDSLRKSRVALVAANAELEAFSYSVSHDLRAPLRHVSGFVQLLQANAKGKLDDTGNRYLDVISGAAKKMGELIDDLLLFSRTGRAQMHIESIPLGPLVDECRRELEPETRGRAIEWKIGELPEVSGDRALLRQVLANLLGNAVKYSCKQPAARIEVSARSEGGETIVCVRDNGAGFDMKYVDKLFGVFQRLHSESEFEGTGIGLANVRRIVVRHGGRAWAEGEVDKGAAFYFSLPIKPADADKEEPT
jgi:ABC-type amino acid transport substrate-binding protein/nitrogen-specific signal transduction histidine kinase